MAPRQRGERLRSRITSRIDLVSSVPTLRLKQLIPSNVETSKILSLQHEYSNCNGPFSGSPRETFLFRAASSGLDDIFYLSHISVCTQIPSRSLRRQCDSSAIQQWQPQVCSSPTQDLTAQRVSFADKTCSPGISLANLILDCAALEMVAPLPRFSSRRNLHRP